MIRKAFVMAVNPDQHLEYERRHDVLWPELARVFRDHGVHKFSIFLHPETHQLFAYTEIESEEQWRAIAQTPICKKWWAYMRDIMPSNPDDSPVSIGLREVFDLGPVSPGGPNPGMK
jgi:L-rhamnose mutarotase